MIYFDSHMSKTTEHALSNRLHNTSVLYGGHLGLGPYNVQLVQ
jgi:hypothetical protein